MRKRIILNYIVILVILSLVSGIFAYLFIRHSNIDSHKQRHETSIALIEKDMVDRLTLSRGKLPSLFRLAQEYARLTGLRVSYLSPEGAVLADSINNSLLFQDFSNAPMVLSALRGTPDLFKVHAPEVGQDYYYYARTIELPNGQRYILCLGEHARDLDQLLDGFLTYFALSTLIGLTVASVLSIITSEAMVRPLQQITEAARMISTGHIAQHIPIESNDEIGELASSFNTMSQELQRNIEQMREVDELRRNFIANVSHELKTPLTSILGFVETLKSNDLPAEKRDKALDVIEGESRRLQEMISKLLVLSHVERHRNTNPVLFNLGELLREILAMMRPLASERSIRIEDQNPIPRIDVINDPELIKIVLVNLIDNAIKYNVDGGEVRVAILEEGDYFIASVSDTGVGIPPKDLEHIFERFYRVDRNRNISPGSGLGLSISKHVLLTLGGEIKAESELGVGTKFTIRVPRLHAQS